MANRDAPAGFQVVGHVSGGEQNRFHQYHIADALAASIFRGDLVIPVNTSKNITVQAAVANRVIGVFDGCFYIDPNGEVQFRPRWISATSIKAGTSVDANVYDDPKSLFEVQASGDFAQADIGALANPTAPGTGSALTGQSAMELDSTTIGSGAVLKIMDISRKVDNGFGENAKVVVGLALHYLGGAMTAI
jgi:hypothetical protein